MTALAATPSSTLAPNLLPPSAAPSDPSYQIAATAPAVEAAASAVIAPATTATAATGAAAEGSGTATAATGATAEGSASLPSLLLPGFVASRAEAE